jgi:hypothetical protein
VWIIDSCRVATTSKDMHAWSDILILLFFLLQGGHTVISQPGPDPCSDWTSFESDIHRVSRAIFETLSSQWYTELKVRSLRLCLRALYCYFITKTFLKDCFHTWLRYRVFMCGAEPKELSHTTTISVEQWSRWHGVWNPYSKSACTIWRVPDAPASIQLLVQ